MRPLGIKHFLLDPHVAHLNHGSFGAVPRPVIKARWDAAAAVERSPERHYRSDLSPALASARTRLASFPGVESASLAWVKNASEAMQVILHAVAARPGEVILLTEHAYSWVQAAVERTALVVLDQITSASALRLPLEQVLAAVPEGIPVAIDGAHAPGLIPRLVPARASFWFGNLHKWAFAPRSVAALVVAPAWRARVRPLIASAIAERGYPEAFDDLGTQDTTPILAVGAALDFPGEHLGVDFEGLRSRNCALLTAGFALLSETLPLHYSPDQGIPMRTLHWGGRGSLVEAGRLGEALREAGVEIAVVFPGGTPVRAGVGASVRRLGGFLAPARGAGTGVAQPLNDRGANAVPSSRPLTRTAPAHRFHRFIVETHPP